MKILNKILKQYGTPRPTTNQWGRKGELHIKNDTKIKCHCEKCFSDFEIRYGSLKNRGDKILCNVCYVQRNGKIDNNRKKAFQTNLKRYGIIGTPRKGIKHPIRTEKQKINYSISAKKRLSDKKNHPMFGKKHSIQSKLKMSKSNSISWANKIIAGTDKRKSKKYKSGSFYSVKMNKNIKYRSSYEFVFYKLLEECNQVKYYVESIKIKYFNNGLHYYIPDVFVEWDTGKKDLIEIKPKKLQTAKINKLKFESAELYCNSNKIGFKVLDKGEFFKYVFSNIDEMRLPFSHKFMTNLNLYINVLTP